MKTSWLGFGAMALLAVTALPVQGQDAQQRAARQAAADAALREDMARPRPMEGTGSVWLEEMTWMEVRDALRAGYTTVIVPTGGIEQNGPYLALGKHNYVLQGACEGIARQLGNALCAPIMKLVPEGGIDEPSGHMRYPGTISLREETFESVLTDVGESLAAHGFTDIVYIGDSGGNQQGMEAVAAKLDAKWDRTRAHFIPEYYQSYTDAFGFMKDELGMEEPMNEGIHDDYIITSVITTVDPEAVRWKQRMDAGNASINGISIEDLERTREMGRRILDFRVRMTADVIREKVAAM